MPAQDLLLYLLKAPLLFRRSQMRPGLGGPLPDIEVTEVVFKKEPLPTCPGRRVDQERGARSVEASEGL